MTLSNKLVFGYTRKSNHVLSHAVPQEVVLLIEVFYPSNYQIKSVKEYELPVELSTLKGLYDPTTHQTFICGKRVSDKWNVCLALNSNCNQWISFQNNPPYYWKIGNIINCNNEYCIFIAKDADLCLKYMLFDKKELKWITSVNKIISKPQNDETFGRIQCIIISKYNLLVIIIDKSIDFFLSKLEIQLFNINDINNPIFIQKKQFAIDIHSKNVIKHPLYDNKIVVFGGWTHKDPIPFVDTFMIISINLDLIGDNMNKYNIINETNCDTIFDGPNGVNEILENVVKNDNNLAYDNDMNQIIYSTYYPTVSELDYSIFGYCLVDNQLFLFGGYSQHTKLKCIIMFDFMCNKWKLSTFKLSAKTMPSVAIYDKDKHQIHLFTKEKSSNGYKKHLCFCLE